MRHSSRAAARQRSPARRATRAVGRFATIMAVAILAMAMVFVKPKHAAATLPNYRFCFHDLVGLPAQPPVAPVINGIVTGDPGWHTAWHYAFGNGTFTHDVDVQGIKDATNIYLSFEVNGDLSLDATDMIVVGFGPSGGSATARRLYLFPVVPGAAASPIPMEWHKGYTGNSPDPAGVPAGIVAKSTVSGGGTNWSWTVEVKIPRAAAGIPPAGDFGMYMNIVPTNGPLSGPFGVASEYPWPAELASVIGLDYTNTPDIANWGAATVAAATCNGVSIDAGDITVNGGTNINLTSPNSFHAVVHNNSVTGAGAAVAAAGVAATFKIANFGISSLTAFGIIPATSGTNPTAPQTVPASSTFDHVMGWTLNPGERALYTAHSHQCILVELDNNAAPTTTTVFTNRSAARNMDFVPGSRASRVATINTKGFPLARGQGTHAFFLTVNSKESTLSPQRDPYAKQFPMVEGHGPAGPNKLISQLEYTVAACRLTGSYITIHKTRFDMCQRAGAYGFLVRHWNEQVKWASKVSGEGLKPTQKYANVYSVAIPAGRSLDVTHSFESQPSRR
jgi:hypothetical protein